jgi:GNAT superfamily N-acetyltransferase
MSTDLEPTHATIRPRLETDLPACEQLVRVVYELDGYPGHWPRDLRDFLAQPDAIAAWVALMNGEVVGHVALLPDSSDASMDLAMAATGLALERLGFVSRLFVSPEVRRHGVGRRLLEAAAPFARERGLHPVLDVVTRFQPAIDLYESSGWTRAGVVTARIPGGVTLEEFVYVGPDVLG